MKPNEIQSTVSMRRFLCGRQARKEAEILLEKNP
jgi:hypothetical protein